MPRDRIHLATVGAAHGVKGEVRVKSFTSDPAVLGDYGPLHADDGRVFEIERLRPAKGDMLVVKFRSVGDRNAAEALNGLKLHVDRDALPAPEADEFYHADLIGLTAVGAAGETLGTVVAIYNHGAGDVLEIAPGRGPSLLIPFTRAAVPGIDIAGGRITVIPPEEVEGEPQDQNEEDNA